MVFVALILSRIIYALPAWGGNLTRQLQERLGAFLKRTRKFGFCDANYTTAELLDQADTRLFRLVQRPEYSIHHLLPDIIDSCSMESRHRGHSFPFLSVNIICIKLLYFTVSVQICLVSDGCIFQV